MHTFILSDIHLAEAEPNHPGRALWKRYKKPRYFIDRKFQRLLEHLEREIRAPKELILNGDIFDFDAVMAQPPSGSELHVNWLEKLRGLSAEEKKSEFKIRTILRDHTSWVEGLRDFIMAGNSAVFVIGNHDIELHWPAVQAAIREILDLLPEAAERLRFCEWFYISEGDTLIEHGNQYDEYCVCQNPVHPLIKKGGKISVRLPFGNLTSRIIVNGMGLFNPHVESTFLMSFREYLVFFYKYNLRVQPGLPFTWAWSAFVAGSMAISEGLLPSMRDPMYTETKTEEIAKRSNATPNIARTLRELHVHPAIYNPFKIFRELWLDRLFLLLGVLIISFQVYTLIYLVIPVPFWVFFIPLFAFLIPFVFYARSVKSEVVALQDAALDHVPMLAQITKVKRVIFGHTHREFRKMIGDVEVINTGNWSPAYKDPECTQGYGRKCFAWIRPVEGSTVRESALYSWEDPGISEINVESARAPSEEKK